MNHLKNDESFNTLLDMDVNVNDRDCMKAMYMAMEVT